MERQPLIWQLNVKQLMTFLFKWFGTLTYRTAHLVWHKLKMLKIHDFKGMWNSLIAYTPWRSKQLPGKKIACLAVDFRFLRYNFEFIVDVLINWKSTPKYSTLKLYIPYCLDEEFSIASSRATDELTRELFDRMKIFFRNNKEKLIIQRFSEYCQINSSGNESVVKALMKFRNEHKNVTVMLITGDIDLLLRAQHAGLYVIEPSDVI